MIALKYPVWYIRLIMQSIGDQYSTWYLQKFLKMTLKKGEELTIFIVSWIRDAQWIAV